VPALQDEHALEPAVEDLPASQLLQLEEVVAPVLARYFPAEQLSQLEAPVEA